MFRHSIAHALITFQRPYATLIDSTGQPQKYDIPSFRPRPASSRILRLFRELKLDADLYSIIPDIVTYTGDVSSWFSDKTCPLDPLELQKHACLLNYRLFDWYMIPSENNSVQERSPIDQSICLTLIIFLIKISHPFNPSYPAFVLTPVRKLRAALSSTSIFRWAKSPTLLLWVLTMGAQAAYGSAEYGFFVQYCSVAFADQGFDGNGSAEELLEKMRGVLLV